MTHWRVVRQGFGALGLLLSAAGAALAGTTGSIRGTVADAATGKPIAGAAVAIVGSALPGTGTDAEGRFVFAAVPPGTYAVEASMVGYAAARATDVMVVQDVQTEISLTLQAQARVESTVRVTAPLVRSGQSPTMYVVSRQEEQMVRGQPDQLYQLPGLILGQPGAIPDASGFPHIRGGRADHLAYLIDNILVSEPNTDEFGTNLVTVGLDRLNLYTGGFRAEYGQALSGVANQVIRTGASIRGGHAELSVGNKDYRSLVLERGDVNRQGLNWYLSGILWSSHLDPETTGFSDVPASADGVAKFIYTLGAADKLTGLWVGGYARYNAFAGPFFTMPGEPSALGIHTIDWDLRTNAPVTVGAVGDFSKQYYGIGSLTWQHSLATGSTLAAQVYRYDARRTIHALSADVRDMFQHRSAKQTGFRLDYTRDLPSGNTLKTGVWLMPSDNLQYLVNGAAAGKPLIRDRNVDTVDMAAYAQTTLKASSTLTADLGLRWDGRRYNRKAHNIPTAAQGSFPEPKDATFSALSPRLGLAYQAGRNTVARMNVGRYVQYTRASLFYEERYSPSPTGQLVRTAAKSYDLKPESAFSVDLGLEHQFGKSFALSVTPYWRRASDLVELNPPFIGPGYYSVGSARMRGLELKATARSLRGWSGWLSYTLSSAEGTNSSPTGGPLGGDIAPTGRFRLPWDQRHTLFASASRRFGRWELNPELEWGSGFPYGDPGTTADTPDESASVPIFGPNGKQKGPLPNQFATGSHLNLSLNVRYHMDADSYAYISVQNLLNRRDVTAMGLWDATNAPVGFRGDHWEYVPVSRLSARFLVVGISKRF